MHGIRFFGRLTGQSHHVAPVALALKEDVATIVRATAFCAKVAVGLADVNGVDHDNVLLFASNTVHRVTVRRRLSLLHKTVGEPGLSRVIVGIRDQGLIQMLPSQSW